MYIKSINNVINFKGLPNGFNVEFDENITYIIGENFQGKTTLGSLFNWCLTGTNLYGKEKEQVLNDKTNEKRVLVDVSFVDNFGIEHRLVREKTKEMMLILDGREIEQGALGKYYHDKEIFLAAHNPYYFFSLEPKEQKRLLGKILPSITPEQSFEFLQKNEKEIIKSPIQNLNLYTEQRNFEINELEKEYAKNLGMLQAYRELALKHEGSLIVFEKEIELQELKNKLNNIATGLDEANLKGLQKKIDMLTQKLNEILQNKLPNITQKYNKEKEKLQSINSKNAICYSCLQEIKNDETKRHLKSYYEKQISSLQEQANVLKCEFGQLLEEKNKSIEIFQKLSTPDMIQIEKEKQELKKSIDILQNEKNEIVLHNKEVQIKKEQIDNAKKNIEVIEKAQLEIQNSLELAKKQKKIADKLKILVIEAQKEEIEKHLNKVNILFSKVNKTDEKIIECCNIQYENRDYHKLSRSQQMKAGIEISNLFNKLSGIKAPVFIDDAESTTNIDKVESTQTIISSVIKYNPLEVLYDYDEMLGKKSISLKREIDLRCNSLKRVA